MQDILKLIRERQSARGLFDVNRPVAGEDLRQILEAGCWAPTAHNMQNFEIIVVDDRGLIESISQIEYQVSDVFINEHCAQLSFSEEELLRKKVGLLGTMFPPYMKTPVAKDSHQKIITSLGKRVQTSPVLLIVVYDPARRAPASEGDFLGIMSLGCVMENMWLMAHSLGIGFHIMSTLSNEAVAKEVKKRLGIPAHLKIGFACRLGYPVSASRDLRVRRDPEDFTHHNRYGNKGIG